MYADDTIFVIPFSEFNKLLRFLNGYNETLKYNIQEEQCNKIKFSDILIIRPK